MKFNLIKINSTYLTRDGLSSGDVSITELPDLLKMRLAPRNVEEDLDGGAHIQFGEYAGFVLEIRLAGFLKADLDDLITEINNVEDAEPFHNIVIGGDTGNFDLDCAFVSIGNSGEVFNSGTVKAITLVFKVDTMNVYTP